MFDQRQSAIAALAMGLRSSDVVDVYRRRMPPVARTQRVIKYLATRPNQRARRYTVVKALAEHGLTADQSERAIEKLLANPTSNVTASKGGNLTYWGTEVGSQVALYSAVQRVLGAYLGPRNLGLRNIQMQRPPHGKGTGQGVWTRPDLLAWADPKRRRSSSSIREIHALEIERRAGFDVRSVYQAYEQSRGSNFAWVFAHTDEIDLRTKQAADEFGVGIVTFTNPASFGSYAVNIPAAYREVDASDRTKFHERCKLEDRP